MSKIKAEEWPGILLSIITITIMVALVTGAFYGWILMLLLGVIHGNISDAVPAVGYAECFWPAVLFRILIGQVQSSNEK
jgi:hypothetical protein